MMENDIRIKKSINSKNSKSIFIYLEDIAALKDLDWNC